MSLSEASPFVFRVAKRSGVKFCTVSTRPISSIFIIRISIREPETHKQVNNLRDFPDQSITVSDRSITRVFANPQKTLQTRSDRSITPEDHLSTDCHTAFRRWQLYRYGAFFGEG